MVKKSIIRIFLLTCFIHGHHVHAENEMNLPMSTAKLVIDEPIDYSEQLPRNFRTSKEAFTAVRQPMPSTEGLAELAIAGSAQFSPRTLSNALKLLENKVYIIDLRRETHGFIDEVPICWYAPQNHSNLNLTSNNILKMEDMLLADLSKQPSLIVGEIVDKDNGHITKTKSYLIDVENVRSEAVLASEFGANYLRLAVSDHHHPDDDTVEQFLTFFKNLPPQTTLYFHCRGGKGRTTLFMAMVDMLHNAKKVSFSDIILRQHLIGGSDLFSPSSEDFKSDSIQARKNFAAAFYEYAKSRNGYPKQSWSQWQKKHPVKN